MNANNYHAVMASIARCQQAIDQLRACEDEFKAVAATCGQGQVLAEATSDFRIEMEIARLSQREAQVFGLVGGGLTTQQVGQQLNISTSTVETYRERLKSKLGLISGGRAHSAGRSVGLAPILPKRAGSFGAGVKRRRAELSRMLWSLDQAKTAATQFLNSPRSRRRRVATI